MFIVWTVFASSPAAPPNPLTPLPFTSNGRGTQGFVPTTVYLKEGGCGNVGWIQLAPVAGTYEHDNENSGSIKGGKFLEQMSNYQLLK
jgi:hypothetical protein